MGSMLEWIQAIGPDWIQAIGSLVALFVGAAAIWASFAVFKKQAAENKRLAEEDHRQNQRRADADQQREIARQLAQDQARSEIVRLVLRRAKVALNTAHRKATGEARKNFNVHNADSTASELRHCLQILNELALVDFPNSDLVQRLVVARYYVDLGIRRAEKIRLDLEREQEIFRISFLKPFSALSDAANLSKPLDMNDYFRDLEEGQA